jgi:hydrogenase maturation protease
MSHGYWEELERPAPHAVHISEHEVRAGSRVRLHPNPGADIWDIALAGRTAVVEAVEQDMEGRITLAVVVEDDPGRELGFARQPGHRFFFSPDEVEPLGTPAGEPRILIAGIGNVFLGDDGFGVALADHLARRALPENVDVVDFGLRGMDLAFAMQDYDAVMMLDAMPRGQAPGTLYVIEVDRAEGDPTLDAHGMDPVKVLGLARAMGGVLPRTFVVGCEPETRMTGDEEEIVAELSEPMRAALDPAVELVESLLQDIRNPQEVSTS